MRTNARTVALLTRSEPCFPLTIWTSIAAAIALAATGTATGQVAAPQKPTRAQQKAELSYPEAVDEARRNVPPAGFASIYVLRPSKVVGLVGCFVLEVDHRIWGGLANGQYSWDILSPGEHFFDRTMKGGVSLDAQAGRTYYVVISAGGLGTGGVRSVSPTEGEKIRRSLSLNPDRWLLRQYLANWASVRVGMTFAEVQHLVQMSEGHSVTIVGGDMAFHGVTIDGDILITEVGRKEKEYRFNSMLGYNLTFVNEILTEKHDGQGSADRHGCPAPVRTP
jgi:hypothetical protein